MGDLKVVKAGELGCGEIGKQKFWEHKEERKWRVGAHKRARGACTGGWGRSVRGRLLLRQSSSGTFTNPRGPSPADRLRGVGSWEVSTGGDMESGGSAG